MSDADNQQDLENDSDDDLGANAHQVLTEILRLSQIEAAVELDDGDERIRICINPASEDDAKLLVGRHGRNLHALQFVSNRIVNRYPDRRKPITIEIAGFTDAHKERLQNLAQRLSQCVAENKVEVSILGMNPADRRTVHMATKDQRGISTFSQDEGVARRLVITPQD
jgi:spoIIIJ-associated protein